MLTLDGIPLKSKISKSEILRTLISAGSLPNLVTVLAG
jgi:hypothetical protein